MLDITHLHAGYKGESVVHLPHLSLPANSRCLLKGPSGSGKTTLLHTLAGLLPPVSGEIRIQGTDPYALPETARDRFRGDHMGLIFQTLHLVKSLNVLDNVLLGAFVNERAQNKEKALSLLSSAGLTGLHDKPVTSLSQGQAQRVAVARALLPAPALILADEPTSSLDDHAAEQIMQLLIEGCATTQSTLIVSSHDARITPYFTEIITLPVRSAA